MEQKLKSNQDKPSLKSRRNSKMKDSSSSDSEDTSVPVNKEVKKTTRLMDRLKLKREKAVKSDDKGSSDDGKGSLDDEKPDDNVKSTKQGFFARKLK